MCFYHKCSWFESKLPFFTTLIKIMLFTSIIFIPILSSIVVGFGGRFLGFNGSSLISCGSILLSCVFSWKVFFEYISTNQYYVFTLLPWIESGLFSCNWGFLFDSLTFVMLIVITTISLLVHIYSTEYMKHDPHFARFMAYLSLFTFFMLILVTANNFLQMFVGWEGVGFCSYLLINFWFTRLQANKAAIKAMIVNRISDFALVLGFLTIFLHVRSLDYNIVLLVLPDFKSYWFSFFNIKCFTLDLICLLLFIGAMGKSAQMFLHVWLPDAMEGPTPVSALIHAATMVTAGVFLLARCSEIFENSQSTLNFIMILGSITAFFASTVGLVQNDLKKVIAYSTCSQLGYMMFACGSSNYNVGVFHLFNHAFFKALLFLSAGSIIHAVGDEQDMRRMGGLRRILPFSYMMCVIGSLSLIGFPFLTGFYSKDSILEVTYSTFSTIGHFAYWLGIISACCTAFYSTRLVYLVFLTKTNVFKRLIISVHEPEFRMILPLALLALSSIFFGFLFKDLFIGIGTNFWLNSIFINPINSTFIDSEFLPIVIKLNPVVFSLIGISLAVYFYQYNSHLLYKFKTSILGRLLYNFFNRKWFFDKLYNELFVQYIIKFSYFTTYKVIDKGIIELFGPTGLTTYINTLSTFFSTLQTGYIYNYLLIYIVNSIFLLMYLSIFLV